ncbi:MAG: serine/threonine-protein kinase [Kofleriaceae bacterium]
MSASLPPDARAGAVPPAPDDHADGLDDVDETRDSATLAAAPAARRRVAGDNVHEFPTQQLPGTRGLPSVVDGETRHTTATTPMAAMQAEELERTRAFGKLAIAIGVGAAAAVGTAGGDPLAKALLVAAIAAMTVAIGVMLWRLRDPANLSSGVVAVAGGFGFLAVLGGVNYWGIASPASAVMLFGIYFFSLGQFRVSSLALYLAGALGHAVLATLIITHAIPELSVIKTLSIPLREQIISQITVQLLYGCAFYFGRRSRRATIEAVERLDRAVRAVSMREALLAEVRQELDRALKVGGPGRYTDQEVGSYRLGTLIGRGGMGEVYEATSVHDGRDAAVKLLHPSTLADPQAVARFVREAEIAACLESPNLVAVYEVGLTSGEIPFIAMERLRGKDLAHHLRRVRRLSPSQAAELVAEVAAGLTVAHDGGVVHRDLKPHNLFLAEKDGRHTWKLLDFGVSKLAARGGTLTAGHVIGTPAYMAPEQARGEDVDHRADCYALAAIAYRCLTGHPAFTGKDVPTTLYDVVYKMPTRPSLLISELAGDLDRVLAVGLAKDRTQRFASATALAAALAAAVDGKLDGALRDRADALLATHGWGQRL